MCVSVCVCVCVCVCVGVCVCVLCVLCVCVVCVCSVFLNRLSTSYHNSTRICFVMVDLFATIKLQNLNYY